MTRKPLLGPAIAVPLALAAALAGLPAVAGPAQDAVIASLMAEAKAADPAFAGFDAAAGEKLFRAQSTTGKPDTPSCTTCHTSDPRKEGRTRVGKAIAPMALSRSPDRFSDPAKVAKWFERNCASVLGRPCTAQEKGDFLTYMISQ